MIIMYIWEYHFLLNFLIGTEELTNQLYHSGTHCHTWNCAYAFRMSLRLCLSLSCRKTSGERIAENGANYYHLVYKVTAGLNGFAFFHFS